ncbi:MAG: carboxypeptidase-like regulatory domain-containing protein, partial [Bryobacteraceae bacterium]
MRSALVSLLLITCAMFFLAGNGEAQVTQSSILGAVQDPSGAAIVGASVSITNLGTNIERSVTTNESGDYRVSGLAPGRYRVKVSSQGFESMTFSDVVLVANQIRRVDAILRVGDLATTVEVTGSAVSQIETEVVTLSNTKSSTDFQELPMSAMGRSFFNITAVTAGVQGDLVNGGRGTANNFTIDGVTVNDPISSK